MLKCLNVVFTSVFSMECVLKIVAFGVLVRPGLWRAWAPGWALGLPRGPVASVCPQPSSRCRWGQAPPWGHGSQLCPCPGPGCLQTWPQAVPPGVPLGLLNPRD